MTIESYLPQRAPILLIKKIISASEDAIVCQVDNESLAFFQDKTGRFLACTLLEILAQTSAVMHGRQRENHGDDLILGMLSGCKNFDIYGLPQPDKTIIAKVEKGHIFGSHQIVKGEISQDKKTLARGAIYLYLRSTTDKMI